MELREAMEARRSMRKYEAGKKVTREQVEELIQAAYLAPSWKNSETPRYYVAMSEDVVRDIRENCLPAFNQNNSAGAPVLIVTAFVKGISGFNPDGTACNELGDGWGCYDLGLNNENLVLKAKELGLDTLIMGIRDGEGLREKLSIPEDQEIVSVGSDRGQRCGVITVRNRRAGRLGKGCGKFFAALALDGEKCYSMDIRSI